MIKGSISTPIQYPKEARTGEIINVSVDFHNTGDEDAYFYVLLKVFDPETFKILDERQSHTFFLSPCSTEGHRWQFFVPEINFHLIIYLFSVKNDEHLLQDTEEIVVRNLDAPPPPEKYICPICGAEFEKGTQVFQHIETVHAPKPPVPPEKVKIPLHYILLGALVVGSAYILAKKVIK